MSGRSVPSGVDSVLLFAVVVAAARGDEQSGGDDRCRGEPLSTDGECLEHRFLGDLVSGWAVREARR